MTSSWNFSEVVLFFLSILVTGPSLMLISSLVLELLQFSFIRDWPEIQKSEIPPYGSNLARMSKVKCHWMLKNTGVTMKDETRIKHEQKPWLQFQAHSRSICFLPLHQNISKSCRTFYHCHVMLNVKNTRIWDFF